MKTYFKILQVVALVILTFSIMESCTKKEEPNMVPDPVLDKSYDGTLVVNFTNSFPRWSETSLGMRLSIDKDLGTVLIEEGSLEYNGDTILVDSHGEEDSRIERGGFWNMKPQGELSKAGDVVYIDIDAGITVYGDVTNVYAKDDYGTWILVVSQPFEGTPNSELSFVLQEAIDGSAVVQSGDQFGSITWTLGLVEAP